MWPPSRGHLSCSASVDVAPRDITFCPEAGKSREKGECSVRERGKLTSVERVREREESGSKGEEGRQNNCWSDELVGGGEGGRPCCIPRGLIPDTRRPNSTYFCDPNGMSQRLMFLPLFQPPPSPPLPSPRILSVSSSLSMLLRPLSST